MSDHDQDLRILLVANYQPDAQISMQRFAGALQTGLTGAGFAVETCRPLPVLGRLLAGNTGGAKWLGYVDKFAVFPGRLRRRARAASRDGKRCVVHICDHSNSMYAAHLQNVPHAVTCHDLLAVRSARGEFVENAPRWSGRRLQQWIVRGLQTAAHVVCVSDATRRDLARFRSPALPVSVVLNGLNHPFSPMPKESAWRTLAEITDGAELKPGTPFILHVGGNVWYKNRPGVLRIYDEFNRQTNSPHRLVMLGPPFTPELEELDGRLPAGRRTIRLPGATNEQLCALYSLADAFLFPSLHEGFGWPIIEAQACGCPVVTPRAAPMTEVGGEAAVYHAPGEIRDAAEKLRSVIAAGEDQRLRRVRAGLENVGRFSPARMVNDYLGIYRQLVPWRRPGRSAVGLAVPSTSNLPG